MSPLLFNVYIDDLTCLSDAVLFFNRLDPMVCHTIDVLYPFISVLCHSD